MNKQFALLALATTSLNLGIATSSFADKLPSTLNSSQSIAKAKPITNVNNVLIGKLKLGMTPAQVVKILGEPLITQSSYNACFLDISTVAEYPELNIQFGSSGIVSMETTSQHYSVHYGTKEAVKVGDPISKARKIYGKFDQPNGIPAPYTYSYINDSGGGLNFKTNSQGIITAIGLSDQGC
jgi:hypothetical protein